MDHIYKNIEEYNPNKKRKTFIVFDDMIADNNNMISNKKLNPIVTELLIRGRKLNISLVLSHKLISLFFLKAEKVFLMILIAKYSQ